MFSSGSALLLMLTNKGWVDGNGSNLGGRFGKPRGGLETRGGRDRLEGPAVNYPWFEHKDHLVTLEVEGVLEIAHHKTREKMVLHCHRMMKMKRRLPGERTYGFIENRKRLETYSLKEREHVVFGNKGWSNDSSFMEETLFKSAVRIPKFFIHLS
uniref:Uncharacterized protein n=1 Tax=Tanacetum cinerariifolium TaxID=118510 RepID=A0A6L2P280_TANCI|nr:hypothetical protein [Tanacetum cinerariifolium]